MPTLTLQRSHLGLQDGPPKSNLAGLFSPTASRNYLLWPSGAPHLDSSSNLKSHVTPFRKASLTFFPLLLLDLCYGHLPFQFLLPHLPGTAPLASKFATRIPGREREGGYIHGVLVSPPISQPSQRPPVPLKVVPSNLGMANSNQC